jgi:hypothetical protein
MWSLNTKAEPHNLADSSRDRRKLSQHVSGSLRGLGPSGARGAGLRVSAVERSYSVASWAGVGQHNGSFAAREGAMVADTVQSDSIPAGR